VPKYQIKILLSDLTLSGYNFCQLAFRSGFLRKNERKLGQWLSQTHGKNNEKLELYKKTGYLVVLAITTNYPVARVLPGSSPTIHP
jgi:hypothetical protein